MKFNKICKFALAVSAAAVATLSATPLMANEEKKVLPDMSSVTMLLDGSDTDIQKNKLGSNAFFSQTGFVNIDGKDYYIDGFGMKTVGSAQIDGNTYFFNAMGEMEKGFVEFSGQTFYFDEETGALCSGEVTVNDTTYYLQPDGELLRGWKDTEEGRRYYREDGSMIASQIATVDGNLYSFNAQGVMETNVTRDAYDFGADGIGHVGKSAYQKIADAALAQVGVAQDCTMLVTNSLKAVGINFHGAPYKYLSLGPTTNNPVPGDIIVYQGHVAIYIGNGMAVHGGFNGMNTAVSTVECSNAFVAYVHPNLPL